MANKTIQLNNEIYEYLLSVSLKEPQVLKELRKKTKELFNTKMQIAPEQAQFMALLIKLMKVKKAIEIGVFTGYSSLNIAIAMDKDAKLIACEINKKYVEIAKYFWIKSGMNHKIQLELAPAKDTLQTLLNKNWINSTDFIFIDADKENYELYYEFSLKLLRKKGLILIDNVLWNGKLANKKIQDKTTKILRKFNEKLYNDKRVTLSLLPIGDGLTLLIKN